MGLDVFFRDDVTRILASVLEAQRNNAIAITPLDAEYATAYQRGFYDALKAVAVGFGIASPATGRLVTRRGVNNSGGR